MILTYYSTRKYPNQIAIIIDNLIHIDAYIAIINTILIQIETKIYSYYNYIETLIDRFYLHLYFISIAIGYIFIRGRAPS